MKIFCNWILYLNCFWSTIMIMLMICFGSLTLCWTYSVQHLFNDLMVLSIGCCCLYEIITVDFILRFNCRFNISIIYIYYIGCDEQLVQFRHWYIVVWYIIVSLKFLIHRMGRGLGNVHIHIYRGIYVGS